MGVDSKPAGAVTLMPLLVANVVTFASALVSSAVASSFGTAFASPNAPVSDAPPSGALASEPPPLVVPASSPEALASPRREPVAEVLASASPSPAGEKICPRSCGIAITAPEATPTAIAAATATARPRWVRRRPSSFSPSASCARCPA